MASNFKAKRKKLYFDVGLGSTATGAIFPCTQITNGTLGDRYGNLMEAFPALTGSSPPNIKQQRAVSAWFQQNVGSATVSVWALDFVAPTATMARGNTATPSAVKALPYLTVGTLTPLNALSGHDAIYSITAGVIRHFAVRLRKRSAAAATVSGTIYVQRQHSIEV